MNIQSSYYNVEIRPLQCEIQIYFPEYHLYLMFYVNWWAWFFCLSSDVFLYYTCNLTNIEVRVCTDVHRSWKLCRWPCPGSTLKPCSCFCQSHTDIGVACTASWGHGDIWPKLCPRAMSGFMALPQPCLPPVTIKCHVTDCGLGHDLGSCWSLGSTILLSPCQYGWHWHPGPWWHPSPSCCYWSYLAPVAARVCISVYYHVTTGAHINRVLNHVYKCQAELTRPGRVDPEDPSELGKAVPTLHQKEWFQWPWLTNTATTQAHIPDFELAFTTSTPPMS